MAIDVRTAVSAALLGFLAGLVVAGGITWNSQSRPPLASRPVAAKGVEESANSNDDEIKIARLSVGMEERRARQPAILKAARDIADLHRREAGTKGLIGRHVSEVRPFFGQVTGIWITTKVLTFVWDASDYTSDTNIFIEVSLPEFTVRRVGHFP